MKDSRAIECSHLYLGNGMSSRFRTPDRLQPQSLRPVLRRLSVCLQPLHSFLCRTRGFLSCLVSCCLHRCACIYRSSDCQRIPSVNRPRAGVLSMCQVDVLARCRKGFFPLRTCPSRFLVSLSRRHVPGKLPQVLGVERFRGIAGRELPYGLRLHLQGAASGHEEGQNR